MASVPLSHELHPIFLLDSFDMETTTPCPNRYKINTFSATFFSIFVNTLTLASSLLLLAAALRTRRGRRLLAPRLKEGEILDFPFGWMKSALSKQHVLLDEVGLDAMVVIRYLDVGFKFCLVGSLLSIVLVPMYASADNNENLGKFTRFSLSNIDKEKGFGIVVACSYLLNAAFVHFMVGEWQNFMNFRRKQFKNAVRGSLGPGAAQAIRSILVENMPKEMRSAQQLFEYFEKQFGEGSVHSAVLQSDTRALHEIDAFCKCCCCPNWASSDRRTQMRQAVRADVATGIELSSISTIRRPRRTTCAVDESSLLAGINVPKTAREFSQKVKGYTASLANTVSKALPASELVKPSSCSTGFVTFQMVQTRVMAEQVLLSHSSGWLIRPAPESRDLVWSNASTPWKLLYPRNIVAQCICIVGVLFWSVPVTSIQLWSNLESMQRFLPRLFEFSKTSCKLCSTFLVKYVPVVALILLLALLPLVFEGMARRYERHKVKSDIQRIVLYRYMGYLLATLYVAVVSGSVSGTLETILRTPPQALVEVREAVPSVAVYFITFVLARVGITIPILLFYPGLFPGSSCYFATEASDAALILVLGVTYSAIAPLILPACAAYFALASVVYRWLFLYVYEQEFDTSGSFWYDLFNWSVWGMFFSNITLMALAVGHASYNTYSFYATAVLPLTTLVFKAFCERHYARPSLFVALEDAVEADRVAEEEADVTLDYNYYVDPVLTNYSPGAAASAASGASAASPSCSSDPRIRNDICDGFGIL
mmetsp:Transcript_45478/g.99018  ORF Transcript_45478/g.99018 Transcript_45478/m.99018 type:complete len:767 (-) Transcript_45478:75-2375(-)